jgi:hypothetical protein
MIETTSSGVSDQVRAIYSMCRFGATGILLHINGWKVLYGKIEVINRGLSIHFLLKRS